ncbi:MAG: homoprotocatechuate degradation operon regulator HpaR [Pseudomonadales bacterium]|nr:homoprotocatechuate degradation operon regulator HpaR [Pseudomonadales bacterium]
MNEFNNSLPMMLYRALDVVMPEFRRIFLEHGLTEQQWRVLRVLWEDDEQPLLVLAAKTLISSPSLVGVVDRLERDGLVKRQKNQQDRRSVCVTLTPQGAKLEDEVSAKAEAAYQALEKRVGRKEWQQLMTSLEKLAVNG